jgi:hypothetical protein
MNINTKVVFEWSDKRQEYVEIYSEGYEYSGDLILATDFDQIVEECLATGGGSVEECSAEANAQGYFPLGEDPGSEWRSGGAYQQRQESGEGQPKSLDQYLEGGMTLDEITKHFKLRANESQYFTPIPSDVVEATKPGYWDSYEQLREEMTIEPAQRQFETERGTLAFKLGRTGLAKVGQGTEMQTTLRSDFQTKMKGLQFDIASDVEQKKLNATERLNALVRQNQDRALQLDQMA